MKLDLAQLAIRGQLPAPDVELSTFHSWDEVAKWYDQLQQERVAPTAEIRQKAAEITRTAANEDAKIRAIYRYVSTEYRYIGVALGMGRYQPHFASEVLNNGYGDCKDKHTLLAALLNAAGVPAYPALINTSRALNEEVPSPAQFDHVITVVPREKENLWLDTTLEVGPLGYLAPTLRNKPALVVLHGATSGPAENTRGPAVT
jgi:transglutaminase-like putative cysteine protease